MNKKYSLTLAGNDQLSALFKSAGKESEYLTAQLKNQERESRKLARTQKDLSAYAGQRRELNDLSRSMGEANRKVAALAKEMTAAGAPTRKQQRAYLQAKAEAERLSKAHDRLRKSSMKLGTELKEGGVDLTNLARAEERVERAAAGANRQLERQRDTMKRLATAKKNLAAADSRLSDLRGRAVGTAVSMAALAAPISRGVERQSSMTDVAKVVDFSGMAERREFRTGLERLGVDTGLGFAGTAEIAAAAGQSNIAKGEIQAFTAGASQMGVAFEMEARAAGETMAAWRAAMGLSQESTMQLADAVNHVSNNMNAKAADISDVLKRQGAVALSSGLSAEQSASLAGALLSGGATSEVASTTMKNLLGALTKGSAASSSQKSALSALGFDSEALAGDMQADAIGSISEVFRALSEAPIEEQSALVSELFGEESKGGIMPLLRNLPALQKAFKLTADAGTFAGSMQQEYNAKLGDAGHKFSRTAKAFDRLLMVVGGGLLPVLGPLADGATVVLNAVSDFATENETFVSALTMGAAAIVAYKAASLGWMYLRAKSDQLRARNEVRLASVEAQTAAQAGRAAAALSRLNGVLGATAATGAVAGGGRGAKGKAGKRGLMIRAGGPAGAMLAAGLTLTPLMAGDYSSGEETGSAIGAAAGGLGGWAGGAAGGAALGTMILPGVGTAIGGLLGGLAGGFAGGELGDWIGGGIGSLFDGDKLPAPGSDAIGSGVREVKFNSSISLEKAPAHINEEQVAQMVIDKQMAQIAPMLSGPSVSLENSLEVSG